MTSDGAARLAPAPPWSIASSGWDPEVRRRPRGRPGRLEAEQVQTGTPSGTVADHRPARPSPASPPTQLRWAYGNGRRRVSIGPRDGRRDHDGGAGGGGHALRLVRRAHRGDPGQRPCRPPAATVDLDAARASVTSTRRTSVEDLCATVAGSATAPSPWRIRPRGLVVLTAPSDPAALPVEEVGAGRHRRAHPGGHALQRLCHAHRAGPRRPRTGC